MFEKNIVKALVYIEKILYVCDNNLNGYYTK